MIISSKSLRKISLDSQHDAKDKFISTEMLWVLCTYWSLLATRVSLLTSQSLSLPSWLLIWPGKYALEPKKVSDGGSTGQPNPNPWVRNGFLEKMTFTWRTWQGEMWSVPFGRNITCSVPKARTRWIWRGYHRITRT